MFCTWILLAGMLCWSEVVWRDEVRGLSFALQGDSFIDMLRHLRGDGHPALWHILLRSAYLVFGSPFVLKGVAFTVAAASAYVLIYRLKLPLSVQLLALFSAFAIYEYAAVSRNYGISMLLVYVIAAAYERCKHNGAVLGLLLALLANTNVHSVVLVGGFLTFWFLDLTLTKPRLTLFGYRNFALGTAIATVGVILCVLTIYPTFNDAARIDHGGDSLSILLLRAIAAPSLNFLSLYPDIVVFQLVEHPQLLGVLVGLLSVLIFGSILSLVSRPPAMVAALLTFLALSVLFTVVYPGSYRHAALWLVFMVGLTGAAELPPGGAVPIVRVRGSFVRIGRWCLLSLLALQVASGVEKIYQTLLSDVPQSRSQDFSELLLSRPDLKDAIVIADPDYLAEPLPYYVKNRTYLLREQRFGNTVKFTRKARLDLDLSDILRSARELRDNQQVPVIILLAQRLDTISAPVVVSESYVWTLRITPEDIAQFRLATELLQRFGPVTGSETFDAYLLK